MNRSLALVLGALSAPALFAADAASQVKGFAPVSVSSANYRNTPRDTLLKAVDGNQAAVNPTTPVLKPLAEKKHFFFMPGEIFESDLTYEQVTAILTAALAKKGYINGADAQGIIREPDKISLIMRVSYGTRTWRLPTVRATDLTWGDGLVPRPKGRGLHQLGADQQWDHRAGGNDDAFSAIAANASNTQSFGFSTGSSGGAGAGGANAGASGSSGGQASGLQPGVGTTTVQGLSEYGATRDFHLIVVDAFDYQEVKKEGKAAKRLWTTFISAPQQRDEKFSQIAETLARNAVSYFGETTTGLQIYSDVRAEVKIGELIEVKDEQPRK
jgi:hypothetical protein